MSASVSHRQSLRPCAIFRSVRVHRADYPPANVAPRGTRRQPRPTDGDLLDPRPRLTHPRMAGSDVLSAVPCSIPRPKQAGKGRAGLPGWARTCPCCRARRRGCVCGARRRAARLSCGVRATASRCVCSTRPHRLSASAHTLPVTPVWAIFGGRARACGRGERFRRRTPGGGPRRGDRREEKVGGFFWGGWGNYTLD